jgi:hypothetical protein
MQLPYCFFRLRFKPDDHRKIEFPSGFFERLGKLKNNRALVDKILKDIPSYIRVFVSSGILVREMLPLFWLSMQTSSTREEDVLRCVYKMLTYGIKLAPRGSPHIFSPDFEQLLTFGGKRPEVLLSSITRNLMEENYEFLKLKSQLLSEMGGDRQNYETVINQLKRNRRKNRQMQGGAVKYKFLEGTGTEIKYDLTINYFFQARDSL